MAQPRHRSALMRSALAAFFLLLATGLSAQQLPGQINEQITVNVVEVPVYVSRFGRTVTGLTKNDFELTVNGKPQTIDYFDVITNETAEEVAPQQEQQPQVDLDRRRMIVLLFDLSQSSYTSIRRAQEAADKFVQEAPPGDVFAVAILTRNGVEFAAPFIRDRVAVRRALGTLRASKASDAFGIATLAAERTAWVAGVNADASSREPVDRIWDVPGINRTAFNQSTAAAMAGNSERRMQRFDAEIRTAGRRQITEHLGELATRLAPLSGIKHVVLMAEGAVFPPIGAMGSPEAIVSPLTVWDTVKKMHARFQQAGVVLDAIDIAGLVAPWGVGDTASHFSAFSTLHTLSLDTGGTVTRALPFLRNAQRVTYILGFRPSATPVKENAIAVKVRNAPVFTEVRYRRTWSTEPRNGADEGLFLADVLVNDIPQNGMTVALDVERAAGQSVVTATIPGKEILALGNGTLNLDAFVYIFDEQGQVAEWAYRKSALDLVKGRDALSNEPYTITSRVKLAPGRYVAKVLLRSVESDATGFARAEFTVN